MEPAGIEPATSCLQRVRGLLTPAVVCRQIGAHRGFPRSGEAILPPTAVVYRFHGASLEGAARSRRHDTRTRTGGVSRASAVDGQPARHGPLS